MTRRSTSALVDARGRPLTGRSSKTKPDAADAMMDGYIEALPKGKTEDLPMPFTWHILIQPMQIPQKRGSIHIPEQAIKNAEWLRNVAKVWRIGPLAFRDETKYGKGCADRIPIKQGDWIYIDKYAGVETPIHGVKFRIINEDDVRAGAVSPDRGAYRFHF